VSEFRDCRNCRYSRFSRKDGLGCLLNNQILTGFTPVKNNAAELVYPACEFFTPDFERFN
ncbi:MAG: hypothetical protein LBT46_02775, partial [Planctomycetaceae bacterium]|nr:hypothetical protein [Planctomycetaceae bacterium]